MKSELWYDLHLLYEILCRLFCNVNLDDTKLDYLLKEIDIIDLYFNSFYCVRFVLLYDEKTAI